MKALIVLENHFFKDSDNKIWCDRVIDYAFLKRYLKVFNSIIVCGRTSFSNKEHKLLVTGCNVEFIELPDFVGAKGIIKNLREIRMIIKKALKKVDCIIYRAPTHLSLFTYKEALKQNKTLGLEFMMAADKMIEGSSFIHKILNKIIVKRAKKMCMKANGVAYVTEKILQREYPCRAISDISKTNKFITASYSTIDLKEENYYMQKWKNDKSPDVFEIVHIGYMDSYRKGQDVAIKTIKRVLDNGYKVNLTLVGDGKKKNEFEMLVKELNLENNVIFTGAISNEKEKFEILKKSHLMLFPTQSEGLPRTIIEAMSVGLPCISSPVDGIPELLSDEYMIDYTDYEKYANKIIELINDWDKMILISKENYEKSLKYNSYNLEEKRTAFYSKLSEIAREGNNI